MICNLEILVRFRVAAPDVVDRQRKFSKTRVRLPPSPRSVCFTKLAHLRRISLKYKEGELSLIRGKHGTWARLVLIAAEYNVRRHLNAKNNWQRLLI